MFRGWENCGWSVGDSENSPETITFRTGYAARRISFKLKGSTKQFGLLQAPATKKSLRCSKFREPRNHPI